MINRIVRFFLDHTLLTVLLGMALLGWGLAAAPFSWAPDGWPRDPVAVDAIPDLGENQQIVVAEWPGRSPQDLENQVTYPLTTALLGTAGVKTIRSTSILGVASLYLIFEEGVDFYDARSRILEKLNALPPNTLPEDVQPSLGPDATALGQVYWYTLEGRDADGQPIGGWDPQELRSVQDFYVRYALASVDGVAEVGSIGGFVKEYQVDVDPHKLHAYGVGLDQVIRAVQQSNVEVGARTLEVNRAEYLVRGLGYIQSIEDLEQAMVSETNNIPIRLGQVANVQLGPAPRRGGLDKGGAEAVGGVVVARYGANPMEVIGNVKEKLEEVAAGLPSKTLEDGRVSQLSVVPFYDRSGLINETLGTLEEALTLEVLITLLVVLVLVTNMRASVLIASLLPLGVLITFIIMRYAGVQANLVALTGIAIAIGVMVDVGVVFTENILRFRTEGGPSYGEKWRATVGAAMKEVAPAVVTALATTIVSFIPVFMLQAQEGKLFRPLAFTKTFALLGTLGLGLVLLPTLAYLLWGIRSPKRMLRLILLGLTALVGMVLLFTNWAWGLVLIGLALATWGLPQLSEVYRKWVQRGLWGVGLLVLVALLSREWLPLGAGVSGFGNFLFTALAVGLSLGLILGVVRLYPKVLGWCLEHKLVFLAVPAIVVVFGLLSWRGVDWLPGGLAKRLEGTAIAEAFPGLGTEFMPTLDEGAFLYMPTTMPHSGVEENVSVIQEIDRRLSAIPEVEITVGKWGRVNSALDPAPISMFENVILYKPEYALDAAGHRRRFAVNEEGDYQLKNGGTYRPGVDLLPPADSVVADEKGQYLRQWRDHIQSPEDIWDEITAAAQWPGLTSAPKLQPIATRLVMLQTGMRSPYGVKVYAPDLATLEEVTTTLEGHLKAVPGVLAPSVFADRVVGKPYLEIDWDREALARYGTSIAQVQAFLSGAIGGMPLTYTVEGRERYAVRVRYARDFRSEPDQLETMLVPLPNKRQVPLAELADVRFARGPQSLKTEDAFLVGYVLFDKQPDAAEGEVVMAAREHLAHLQETGTLKLPSGVRYAFAGTYENQMRATKRLAVVIPACLLVIFLILYLQFRSVLTSLMVYVGIIVAFSGGFIWLWAYGQSGFLDVTLAGINLREVMQVSPLNLSVAVWVGFIALFGIATDDGVLMATQLKQQFAEQSPTTREEVRQVVLDAGSRRIRPAMMTTATTLIALLPVLTSTGRGAEILVPMAIPTFGGMVFQVMTVLIVPTLYCAWQEARIMAGQQPTEGKEAES